MSVEFRFSGMFLDWKMVFWADDVPVSLKEDKVEAVRARRLTGFKGENGPLDLKVSKFSIQGKLDVVQKGVMVSRARQVHGGVEHFGGEQRGEMS